MADDNTKDDNIGVAELIWTSSPEVYNSLRVSNAPNPVKERAAAVAKLQQQHKTFLELPDAEARTAFSRLAPENQQVLKDFFEDAPYSRESTSIWQKIKSNSRNKFGAMLNAFEKYAWTQTNFYRLSNLKQQELIDNPQAQAKFEETQKRVSQVPLVPGAGLFPSGIQIVPEKKDPAKSFEGFFTANQWRSTFNGEQYFDKDKAKEVEAKYSPAVAKIAKLYAMRKNSVEIMTLMETPEEEAAFREFNDPKKTKESEVFKAINDFDHAKVSPGRDLAYSIRHLDKHSKVPDLYDIVSGLTDLSFILATDPTIWASKASSAFKAARYGLLKLAGANGVKLSEGLDKMFKYKNVRNYWDDLGPKLQAYKNSKSLVDRAQIAAQVSRDFGLDISKVNKYDKAAEAVEFTAVDLIDNLSRAGVKDADSALRYFKDNGITELISLGRKAGDIEPLMPRRTVLSNASKTMRNATATLLGLKRPVDLPAVWDDAEELSKNFGTIEDLKTYRTFTGNLARLFGIAPVAGKEITLQTAESAPVIYNMARLILNPYNANVIKQAWREGNTASRMQLFDGLVLNIGKKLGLSDEEVKALYNRTGRQLYSEDMTLVGKSDDFLGNLGRRKGLTETQLASTAALTKGALADLNKQFKEARLSKKELTKKIKTLKDEGANFSEIKQLEDQLVEINKRVGGIYNKIKSYKGITGGDNLGKIRKSLTNSGLLKEEVNSYIDVLRKGPTDPQNAYQFQQILGSVFDAVGNDPSLSNILSREIDGVRVLDYDLVQNFVAEAFPSAREVADRLNVSSYNPAQLGDAQYGLAYYHLDNALTIPDFAQWSRESNSKFLGSYNGNVRWALEKVVNGWSWATLVPRLGIRSAIEELGLFGIAVPFGDLHRLIIGKKISNEYRYAKFGLQALGIINRNIYRFLRTGEARITEAQRKLIQENPDLLPNIIAKNVTKSKAVMVLSGFDKSTVERWVNDFFDGPFGWSALDEINEGAMNALNVGETAADKLAVKNQKLFGPIIQWNLRAKRLSEDLRSTGEFDNLRPYDYGFDNSWLTQIKLRLDHKTNLNWGKIAIANIFNEDKAIAALVKSYEKVPEVMEKFVLYNTLGPTEFAKRQFRYIIHPFVKSNGLLNEKLIAKVRKVTVDPVTKKSTLSINADKLTFKDLEEFDKFERPETILGIKYMPTTNLGKLTDWLSGGQARLMNVMARQISVLGREPALFANYQIYRKRLLQAEKDMVEQYVAGGTDRALAESLASKWSANIATELTINRTLQYLDNPAVRTNLAFNMRNIARYYRATEDFYRRMSRVVRFDPLAITKFRLLAEGLEHAGFIHTDENGEPYFVYPGDEIVYTAIGLAMRLTGNEDALRQPRPAQLTAKISMLTPSLDPDSAIPTLSGPVSAFGIWAIERYLPESKQAQFRKTILGKYSVSRTLPELLLPGTVSRIWNMFDSNEKASQWASAVRKAHMYNAANGILKKHLNLAAKGGEEKSKAIEQYNRFTEATARNIVVARNFVGLLFPASPTVDYGLDIPDEVREQVNITNLKPEFQKLILQYGNDPQAVDKAAYKWSKLYPGKSSYLLTESEKNQIGTVKATKEAVNWLKENSKLAKNYPAAVAFVVPSNGKYDLEAYTFLQDQEFTEMKDIEKFAAEASVAEDYFYWRSVKNFQDQRIAESSDEVEKRLLRSKWETWSKQYRNTHPGVQVYLDNIVQKNQEKRDVITELFNMHRKGDMPKTESNTKIVNMITIYNEYTSLTNIVTGTTQEDLAFRNELKASSLDKMLEIAGSDDQALAAYRTLFSPLIGE